MNTTPVNESLQKPEFNREFRLGLVVYGGISLAIYMNGVCREFYDAVRGRGIYKLIKALTDSDIVVDIVSGTSAGGINGILLSYALANSDEKQLVDFKDFADIWRQKGDINQLLRQARPYKESESEIDSVLDGEGYYQAQLYNALKEASSRNQQPEKSSVQTTDSPNSEWVSSFDELDLFVTGTDILGKVYRAFDNTGRVIELKDHRTVFHLKHRKNRKEPFQPNAVNHEALAKICRITSCFPVAFPAVTVKLDNEDGLSEEQLVEQENRLNQRLLRLNREEVDQNSDLNRFEKLVDRKLVEWGLLKNRDLSSQNPTQRQLYFVDGGVLDNRPFSYTIQQIYSRLAIRPVGRKLFYIDPSPDRFQGSELLEKMLKPDLLKIIGDSLVGMPRYESISNDLKAIEEHNQRVRRYKFLLATLEADKNFKKLLQDKSDFQEDLYLRCRLIDLRDRVLPLILRIGKADSNNLKPGISETSSALNKEGENEQRKQRLLKIAAQLLTRYATDKNEQKKREEVLKNIYKQIRNLDVEYALRKYFFLTEKIYQKIVEIDREAKGEKSKNGERKRENLQKISRRINQRIELLEVIKSELESMLAMESVNKFFYNLLGRYEQEQQPGSELTKDKETQISKENEIREEIYKSLLGLHRFLLDAKKLESLDEPSLVEGNHSIIPENFFLDSCSEQPCIDSFDEGEAFEALETSKIITSVLKRLEKKAKQLESPEKIQLLLDNGNYKEYVLKSENTSNSYCSLLYGLEKSTEKILGDYPCLLQSFKDFREIDQVIYSYEYLADFHSKEEIELFRISPEDAQLGFSKDIPDTQRLEHKLAGDQLRAFGGFFKRSWRSNDILWGRLDGLNRIVDALLTPEALTHFADFLSRETLKLIEKTGLDPQEAKKQYLEKLIEESLPHIKGEEKEKLFQDLEKLANGQDPTSLNLDEFRDLLVRAGQREILNTDLDRVIEDDIDEAVAWGSPAEEKKSAKDNPSISLMNAYKPLADRFSPTTNAIAVGEILKAALKAPEAQDKEILFTKNYKVGEETIADNIPPVVLKMLLSRTSFVLRDILSTSSTKVGGDKQLGKVVQKTKLYLIANLLLQLFYLLIQSEVLGKVLIAITITVIVVSLILPLLLPFWVPGVVGLVILLFIIYGSAIKLGNKS